MAGSGRKLVVASERPQEVPIDKDSAFWYYNAPADIDGDPLELMIRCEQEDEEGHKPKGTSYREFINLYRLTH